VHIALAIYPGFTALDIVGPFQVLSALPNDTVEFVAAATGLVEDGTGRCPLLATATFDDTPTPDVVVVTGGGSPSHDNPLVPWLAQVHGTSTWTTSVCTGSHALGAAGLLNGLDATTHWASASRLADFGARYTAQRVVQRGRVITAAGVSSGIDMALVLVDRLYGERAAQTIQLAIEYDPQPPFHAGSPETAPPEVVAYLQSRAG
jgi:transcriptional regulator GlxA family with amidase domain